MRRHGFRRPAGRPETTSASPGSNRVFRIGCSRRGIHHRSAPYGSRTRLTLLRHRSHHEAKRNMAPSAGVEPVVFRVKAGGPVRWTTRAGEHDLEGLILSTSRFDFARMHLDEPRRFVPRRRATAQRGRDGPRHVGSEWRWGWDGIERREARPGRPAGETCRARERATVVTRPRSATPDRRPLGGRARQAIDDPCEPRSPGG